MMDQSEHQELCFFLKDNAYPSNIFSSKDKSNFRRKASAYRIQDGTNVFKVILNHLYIKRVDFPSRTHEF